ncbi:hypothetical protein GUITHDRAFT_136160 [Guillardia theta CCMP2712]|uniref:PH domain-containing protein n=1 Tax=Guillardia theta (strain CCMP2712) TaxID=905079 RepID=L1JKB6_GUITC|nr:hypothetical protein GUITHDRAFT_136160 [Guillardia theta CCMP2712]EKX48958.1 hypothetical protein GUITHDRAFT_136160 [Guillardia theta CCMP2712]|eukprot:XP_005835938.1 hypothetical protein GUITHDRAFT_136160 [Guillardia theta CCMP2712]
MLLDVPLLLLLFLLFLLLLPLPHHVVQHQHRFKLAQLQGERKNLSEASSDDLDGDSDGDSNSEMSPSEVEHSNGSTREGLTAGTDKVAVASDDDQPSPFQSCNNLERLIADLKSSSAAFASSQSCEARGGLLQSWVERHKQSQQARRKKMIASILKDEEDSAESELTWEARAKQKSQPVQQLQGAKSSTLPSCSSLKKGDDSRDFDFGGKMVPASAMDYDSRDILEEDLVVHGSFQKIANDTEAQMFVRLSSGEMGESLDAQAYKRLLDHARFKHAETSLSVPASNAPPRNVVEPSRVHGSRKGMCVGDVLEAKGILAISMSLLDTVCSSGLSIRTWRKNSQSSTGGLMVGKAWKCSERWGGGGRWQKRMMIFDLGTGELMLSKDGEHKKKVLGIFSVGKNLSEDAKIVSLFDVQDVSETSEGDEPVVGASIKLQYLQTEGKKGGLKLCFSNVSEKDFWFRAFVEWREACGSNEAS